MQTLHKCKLLKKKKRGGCICHCHIVDLVDFLKNQGICCQLSEKEVDASVAKLFRGLGVKVLSKQMK